MTKEYIADKETLDAVNNKIGEPADTGGTTQAGTVMSKDNAALAALLNTTYGLAALKALIDTLNTNVNTVKTNTDEVETYLKNSTYGLSALETLVDECESYLKNSTYGLNALKNLISGIDVSTDLDEIISALKYVCNYYEYGTNNTVKSYAQNSLVTVANVSTNTWAYGRLCLHESVTIEYDGFYTFSIPVYYEYYNASETTLSNMRVVVGLAVNETSTLSIAENTLTTMSGDNFGFTPTVSLEHYINNTTSGSTNSGTVTLTETMKLNRGDVVQVFAQGRSNYGSLKIRANAGTIKGKLVSIL